MNILKKIYSESENVSRTIFDEIFSEQPNVHFDMHDTAIIGIFEDMLGKTGSLLKLLDLNDMYVLNGISRMIMENYVFLMFILEEETEERGSSYYYSSHMRSIKIYNDLLQDTLLGSKVRNYLKKSKEEIENDFNKTSTENYIENVQSGYIKNVGKLNSKWYDFNGKINNFRLLCKHMDMELEYVLLYQLYSGEVHGQDSNNLLKFEENKVILLKKSYNPNIHIGTITNFLITAVNSIYNYYGLKEEGKKFKRNLSMYENLNRKR